MYPHAPGLEVGRDDFQVSVEPAHLVLLQLRFNVLCAGVGKNQSEAGDGGREAAAAGSAWDQMPRPPLPTRDQVNGHEVVGTALPGDDEVGVPPARPDELVKGRLHKPGVLLNDA